MESGDKISQNGENGTGEFGCGDCGFSPLKIPASKKTADNYITFICYYTIASIMTKYICGRRGKFGKL